MVNEWKRYKTVIKSTNARGDEAHEINNVVHIKM